MTIIVYVSGTVAIAAEVLSKSPNASGNFNRVL